ncbi:alpha/beta hydrolase [Methylobacterium organophilum]|uniref:alpha/beta fold hydrolase n=1 Tax=Methylobacterium organophilum TaxID=410 RepID=UPI001F139A2C|nr:alpha/beta hydrolase [Methylobacterium organophilum]UMY17724.1 alpha/beta hydrolase [Methylobacterium organophilum]
MQKAIGYTPPHLADPRPGRVCRRRVFYLPGYDPEARTRYRLLFVRELSRRAKRFGEPKPEIGPAKLSADGLVQSWTVKAGPSLGDTQTRYDVLLWDDIVMRDFARSKFASAGLLLAGMLHALAAGKLFQFYRLNWKYGNVIVYPFVMLAALGLAAAGLVAFAHGHLGNGYDHSLGLPPWLSISLGIALAIGAVKAVEVFLNRIFFWQLVNDWVFNWQHGQGWRPDYERRLDVFAEIILAEIAADPQVDEILIVGHSTGGLTAAELAARILARDPGLGGEGNPPLALATLGSALPLVALQPQAARLRAEIASLVASRRLVWIDYAAPQDWMNFPGFNPAFDLEAPRGGPIANPTLRSPCFKDIIDPAIYPRVRWRPFRMHFQFLMANDRPGEYDFFAMVLGPQRLRERACATSLAASPKAGSPLTGAA